MQMYSMLEPDGLARRRPARGRTCANRQVRCRDVVEDRCNGCEDPGSCPGKRCARTVMDGAQSVARARAVCRQRASARNRSVRRAHGAVGLR